MKIIGIDQSYTCSGIVVLEDGEMVHSEVYKTPKAMDTYERAERVAGHLLVLAYQFEPDHIGIEGLAFGMRGNATRDLAGLQFVIINKMRFKGNFPVDIIAPNAVKKLATGSGKAKKEEMYEALPQITRKTFDDLGVKKTTGRYDLTDAYWIAKAIEEKYK